MWALCSLGCLGVRRGGPTEGQRNLYPPQPQVPRVVALGTLRGGPPPSQAQVDVAVFLFGAPPPPPITIANPIGLAMQGDALLICDSVLDTVFRWDADTQQLSYERYTPPLEHPFAIDVLADGSRLIADARGVHRFDADGGVQCTFVLEGGELKPGGVLVVDDAVWITNLAAHRIEVLDAATGRYVRSIGGHGTGPGLFALPRGMARTPEGQVCVVDMLNCRVQVLDAAGIWLRDIGQAGDTVGSFGRPRDVAVGPDGTIFVTDAFSQRVQAFASDGRALLAFGEPGSGVGELRLPAGIAVATSSLPSQVELPDGLLAAYYVLVAEQLSQPGVRVYAWLQGSTGAQLPPLPAGEATAWKPKFPGSEAVNPHWNVERCGSCHKSEAGLWLPIPLAETDALCLSCHDGVKAPADPHPIGRPVNTELVVTPAAWPAIAEKIGCVTCHDIQRHCSPAAKRPAVNSVLLRNFDPQRPLEYCGNCHKTEVGRRFSPHRQRTAVGEVREEACLFCHTRAPDIPTDGRRRFEPHLRSQSSALCLRCHSRHWDLSPRGHVDRPVTPHIRQWMLMRELSLERNISPPELARLAEESQRSPALLPLGEGRVTCYSCHNPHYSGLFPPDSELGALARNPEDRTAALRTDWIDLCSDCHNR